MSLRAWKYTAGVFSLFLLAVPVAYSWMIFTRVPAQNWDWWNQLAATFFSVAFAAAVGVWLYSWQTERANADRRNELRAAQVIGIFDMWDLLDDNNLQTVPLPDGTEAKVLLTYLQPMVYEESVKSGLFDASEAMTLSRLSAAMYIYNSRTQSVPPLIEAMESAEDGTPKSKLAENVRDEIDSVLKSRQTVVEAGKKLVTAWSLKEMRKALDIASPDEEDPDPRVVAIVEDHLPKVLPPSYSAGIKANLDNAREAAERGDTEAAHGFIDEAIRETQEVRDSGRATGDFDAMISSALSAKKALDKESRKE